MKLKTNIDNDWKQFISEELNEVLNGKLNTFLASEESLIFPNTKDIFNAFNYTSFEEAKVVIIGQDPYHSYEDKDGEFIPHAHGLCFSVPKEVKKIPPSLKNIFKELKQDLGCNIPSHGNLNSWANQGILLLNATLTVRAHQAGSHQKKGWEIFTDAVIKKISEEKENVVFLLWGKFAQNKGALIDAEKHFVLKAAHPSPFSAYNGFFGCSHFSKTNRFLNGKGLKKIDWEIK